MRLRKAQNVCFEGAALIATPLLYQVSDLRCGITFFRLQQGMRCESLLYLARLQFERPVNVVQLANC